MKKGKIIKIVLISLFVIAFMLFSCLYKESYNTLGKAIASKQNYSSSKKKNIVIYEYENEAFVLNESSPSKFDYFYKEKGKWYYGILDGSIFKIEGSGISVDDIKKGKATTSEYFENSAVSVSYYKSMKSSRMFLEISKSNKTNYTNCKDYNIKDSKKSEFHGLCNNKSIYLNTIIELKEGEKYWFIIAGNKYTIDYDRWK